jgi:hypothetical protein
VPDISAQMWNKFFGFACNATIATLTRSRAGAIARSQSGAAFVSAIIDECARVCAAEGFAVPVEVHGMIRGLFTQPGSTYGGRRRAGPYGSALQPAGLRDQPSCGRASRMSERPGARSSGGRCP